MIPCLRILIRGGVSQTLTPSHSRACAAELTNPPLGLPGPATWRSGYAAACKAVYTGSIPVVASARARALVALVADGDRTGGDAKAACPPCRDRPCHAKAQGVLRDHRRHLYRQRVRKDIEHPRPPVPRQGGEVPLRAGDLPGRRRGWARRCRERVREDRRQVCRPEHGRRSRVSWSLGRAISWRYKFVAGSSSG